MRSKARSTKSLPGTSDQPAPATRQSKRTLRQWLSRLITSPVRHDHPRRGRLLLENLESRQLLAGDVALLSTDPGEQLTNDTVLQSEIGDQDETLPVNGEAQGEASPDLVAFAQALDDAGVRFFGAAFSDLSTEQRQLFDDGADDLPFIEVTGPDRSLNAVGIAEGISVFATWDFPNQLDRVEGVLTLQEISELSGIAIPQSELPTFATVGDQTVEIGSPLHIPIDVYDPDGGPQTVTISVEDPSLIEATVIQGNRSLRFDLEGYGDLVFELFEQRAPTASGRVAELAEAGFYDGIIFHRVIDNFVLQAGDPTATGSGGSTLGDFDDDFHPDLQHNTSGVLSFAKAGDDTNDSQFFITEGPTRNLDFNHSVFGLLVEGEDVREAISEQATNGADRPLFDVVIDTAEVFTDTENSVIQLRALGNTTGSTNVTITVTDADGNTHSEVIEVDVIGDQFDAQPYLEPINVPTTPLPNNSSTQIQLNAIDVEGDAVAFTAQTSAGVNATVQDSGLLTITPDPGFTGTAQVLVDVSRANPFNSDADSQLFTLEFEDAGANVPSTPVLAIGSDTGISGTDGITNAGTLSFTVNNTTAGANVELVDTITGNVLGLAVASGTITTVTTNNIAAAGDGTFTVAARQVIGGEVSNLSGITTIVFDSTNPLLVSSTANLTASVGVPYTTDLVSPEEGNGFVYTLVSGPEGATIDPSSGAITWTPTAAQAGSNVFSLQLTDAAGNVSDDSFTVQVDDLSPADILLAFDIDLLDDNGSPITTLEVGDTFTLSVRVSDQRVLSEGIFTAYLDVLFDNTIVRPVPTATIQHSELFASLTTGVIANGLINEVGGGAEVDFNGEGVLDGVLFTLEMEAIAAGSTVFQADPADDPGSDLTLFGLNRTVENNEVTFGSASLTVAQSTGGAVNDSFTVNQDAGSTSLDVLANDTALNASIISVDQPAAGGATAVANGQIVFTPEANFSGTTTFSYTISDANGNEDTADVTVTVVSGNNPPTAVADTFTVDQNASQVTLDVLANDSTAPDTGEVLTITEAGPSANGATITIASDGQSILYTPPIDFSGVDSFVYTISDGQDLSEVSVTVNVDAGDEGPVAVNDTFTIAEDDIEAEYDVTANDSPDSSGQTFVIDSVRTPSQGGSARVSADGTQFFYQPAPDFFGTEFVEYVLRDTGGGLSVATVTFDVEATNDSPPVANPSVTLLVGSGQSTVLTIAELPANVDGPDETLSFSNLGTPTAGGSVEIDFVNNAILYTPPSATFTGVDTFTYAVVDAAGLSSGGLVTVTVNDLTTRTISFDNADPSLQAILAQSRLRGTDELGAAVDTAPVIIDGVAQFASILPGQYQVEIPAIPFLIGGEEAQSIEVTSAPEDGDITISSNLGRVRAEYISIRDWLGSTSSESILIAVAPGGESLIADPTDATIEITDPSASLSADAQTLTVSGTDATGTEVETDFNTGSQAVELRGQEGDLLLYRVDVESGTVNFTAASTTNAAATAQGEQLSALDVAPPAVSAANAVESSSVSNATSEALVIQDNQTSEGEPVLAASLSTTVADVFVPADSDFLSSGEVVVQGTEEGDLRVANLNAVAPQQGVGSVDIAMESVSSELSLLPAGVDLIADASEVDSEQQEAIDSVFSGEIEIS